MAEILDKNNKAFAGQKLVYSSKGYSQLLSEYGDDISKSTGALYNSIIFSIDGYILTHGMVLKGAVVDTDGGGKDGNVSVKLADDKKSFILIDADGNKTNITFPTVSGDDNVVVSYSNGAYSVSLSESLLGRITTLETSVGNLQTSVEEVKSTADAAKTKAEANATEIEEIKTNAEEVSGKVSTLETVVGGENSGLVKDIADLQAKDTELSNAISAVQGGVDANLASINTINGQITSINETLAGVEGVIDGKVATQAEATLKAANEYAEGQAASVKSELENKISTSIAAADAMRFKGTVSSEEDLNTKAETAKNGDAYKISSAFKPYEVGDMVIWMQPEGAESGEWVAIQTNVDGTTTTEGLTDGGIVIATGTHTIKSVNAGDGINIGNDISVQAGAGISVDSNGVSVNVGAGLEISDNKVAVKLNGTTSVNDGVRAVETDTNGNLVVKNVYNTWRDIKIDGASIDVEGLDFSATFTKNTSGQVDLAWFEL
jgi:hypothetical protein